MPCFIGLMGAEGTRWPLRSPRTGAQLWPAGEEGGDGEMKEEE